jgi:hypothetical protein
MFLLYHKGSPLGEGCRQGGNTKMDVGKTGIEDL